MVCFDLGGVLARINRTWQAAARTSGVATALADEPEIALAELECFDQFQVGKIGLAAYLHDLADVLQVGEDEALLVHNSILVRPYADTKELVTSIRAAGHWTSCLSNTNAPHWEILRSEEHFPAIAALEFGMASHEVKMEKPNAEIFRHFESITGLAPHEIVFFDDGLVNVEGAIEVGWHAHHIDHEKETVPQMLAALQFEGLALNS